VLEIIKVGYVEALHFEMIIVLYGQICCVIR
jgi:hypothetical protein